MVAEIGQAFRRRALYLAVFASLVLLAGCAKARAEVLPCMERAVFGDPAESEYVLPYPAGAKYVLSQSYCSEGGHRDQVAYDFLLPVGDEVVAAREGLVREIREDVPDIGQDPDPGAHNHVLIEHEDGTVAFYAHLKQDSVIVEPGETVAAGQQIAWSGNSGNTIVPHLHFGVYQSWPATEGYDVAVNFRNLGGRLDQRGGLVAGQTYRAKPHEATR